MIVPHTSAVIVPYLPRQYSAMRHPCLLFPIALHAMSWKADKAMVQSNGVIVDKLTLSGFRTPLAFSLATTRSAVGARLAYWIALLSPSARYVPEAILGTFSNRPTTTKTVLALATSLDYLSRVLSCRPR